MESIFSLKKIYYSKEKQFEQYINPTNAVVPYKNKTRSPFTYHARNQTASILSTDYLLFINLLQTTVNQIKIDFKVPISDILDQTGGESSLKSKHTIFRASSNFLSIKVQETEQNTYDIAIFSQDCVFSVVQLKFTSIPELQLVYTIECERNNDPFHIAFVEDFSREHFIMETSVILSKGMSASVIHPHSKEYIELPLPAAAVMAVTTFHQSLLYVAVLTVANSIEFFQIDKKARISKHDIPSNSPYKPQILNFDLFSGNLCLFVLSGQTLEVFCANTIKIENYIEIPEIEQHQLLETAVVGDFLYVFTSNKEYFEVDLISGETTSKQLNLSKNVYGISKLLNPYGFLIFGSNSIIPSNFSFLSILTVTREIENVSPWEEMFFSLRQDASQTTEQTESKIKQLTPQPKENETVKETEWLCSLCSAKIYYHCSSKRYFCSNKHEAAICSERVIPIENTIFVCSNCEKQFSYSLDKCSLCYSVVIEL